jgi:quercetin dioxygenase-like cupin family protein
MDRPGDRLSFLARRLAPVFDLRVVVLSPGGRRPYEEAEWRDALVVLESGDIDLECLGGGRHQLRRGDVLWLTGLPLRALLNHGPEPALLVAVSRRCLE